MHVFVIVPGKIGQNLNRQTEEHVPVARGRYPCIRHWGEGKKLSVFTKRQCFQRCSNLFSVNTHGSGVYVGRELWRMYCVEWKTRNARPARKSREDRRPATGRSLKPVQAVAAEKKEQVRGFGIFTLYSGQRLWPRTLKEAGHVFQLRDVVWLVAAVLLQQGEDPVVFAAGVGRVEGLQLSEHLPPRGSLLLCVLHPWDWLATGSHDLSVSPVSCAGVTLVLSRLRLFELFFFLFFLILDTF